MSWSKARNLLHSCMSRRPSHSTAACAGGTARWKLVPLALHSTRGWKELLAHLKQHLDLLHG